MSANEQEKVHAAFVDDRKDILRLVSIFRDKSHLLIKNKQLDLDNLGMKACHSTQLVHENLM
jgi:hypothetical protein